MEINIIPVAVKERQKFEGRGQKVNCSDGNLDPKRTGLKDNPSVSCIHADKSFVPPTFQGGSLVKETQSESATLETSAVQKLESAQAVPTFVFDIEQIFAKFLQLEVGDGAASADTVRSYIS